MFLYDFAMGMMPRKFDASDKQDRIIYDEDQEVAEMYFILEGFLGIAINQFPDKLTKSFYKIGRKQQGKLIICDHYVINKKRSKFIYIALNDIHAFGVTRTHFREVIAPKYPDIVTQLQANSLGSYKKFVLKPMNDFKAKHFDEVSKKALGRSV
mmetsp:Transcript_5817/g.9296  ORF Transcript_5817/g.9296 Transcript_5817/m.9296 type:complete len:154 (+) Transcript_5817:1895-2356(+)